MKKVIITGGLGYIGMELCKIYSGKSRDFDITVLDNKFYSERVGQLKRWGIKFEQLDILDESNLQKHIGNANLIYHLAGITDVGTTIEDTDKKRDSQVKAVGIKGTKNIIKYSSDKSKIIFPSTHVVFEGLKSVKRNINEKAEPNPTLEYAKGKVKSEKDLIASERNFIILRLGSVYGNSFDSTRINIMTNIFSKFTALDKEIKLYSGGDQLKSLVSVKDVARCMEFVGENAEIKNEIFNCVNENLTVKQVADICKKVNKRIQIVNTKDSVPNKGYSLSNTKIKDAGFEFLYNVEKSIEEMVESWKDREIITTNEEVEIGADNFIDDRGIISNYYFDDLINMIGYVESKKETVRGNHYHPIQTQKCLLIKGSYISVTKDLSDKSSVVETRLINEGDLSTIPPYVAHTMVFLEDSIFLNLVNGEREHENYGVTHTIPYKLVDEKLFYNLIDSYVTSCRVCGGGFNHYLSLGLSPLANNLNNKKSDSNDLYPLDLNFCKQCSNSQLSVVVPPEKMFDNYFYLSSTSQQFREHFVEIAKELKYDLKLKNTSVVVDIGSNDGIFLDPLKNLGINAIGVEPAKNVAKIANSKKLKTLPEYFSSKTVNKIIKKHGRADVVTAFNVFAHGDGLKDILKNTEDLLKTNGEFIFEIQYLLKTLKDLTFDNIYHEHVNYWCLLAIINFFEDSKMKVYKVKEVDTHGGSLRVYATKNKDKKIHESVSKYINIEKKNRLDEYETYLEFAEKVEDTKKHSLEMINKIKLENKKIIGYGAPAKATTILNYFGLSDKDFTYTIDENPLKHNKFIPGTDIQIKNIDAVKPAEYDYVLVLAWNFFDLIKKNNKLHFQNSEFIKLK
jgi:nucleoside-diphosphate-sugar epimerase/2-polyprenyl-3-methyl-5-hydroxy-6-metoxy-1,4-benzoquinol methylase/dTDP-4-dehydrorhamnose 3,5-epimerase-like enzyme